MGKPTGFIEWGREAAPKRAKAERVGDSREFTLPLAPDEAKRQAGRCMDCGVPVCHQGCPLGNLIPDFNDAVYRGRWKEAYETLASTNNFPEFTGRLCPAPCESACVLAINQDAVSIEQMEKEIIERAFAEGWVKARPPARRTGKRVAVVGSGPAGLAAAAQLNQAGHTVHVYERADRAGGLLRYGIPDFKMEKSVVDRRVALLEAEGVTFHLGADVGGAVSLRGLRESHDALLLATGARRARELEVPGRELSGVVQAMDYLEHHNRVVAGLAGTEAQWSATGRRVLILGGGDTGSDCLGTALRQGAASVTQVELFPAPPHARMSDNPWPQWPLVLRTSSSQEEGGTREFGLLTKRLEGRDGKLVALHAVRVELKREGGATRLVEVPGSEERIDVDLLVLAMGFTGPETQALSAELGVALDARGNVRVDGRFATSVEGVYCAGDACRGASLIVWAISDGREAARAMDAYLGGGVESQLPTRGAHLSFGGR
ncbi:glutamate synthase subunit beta [Myxococcaceae bacterium GXIMD 01537]